MKIDKKEEENIHNFISKLENILREKNEKKLYLKNEIYENKYNITYDYFGDIFSISTNRYIIDSDDKYTFKDAMLYISIDKYNNTYNICDFDWMQLQSYNSLFKCDCDDYIFKTELEKIKYMYNGIVLYNKKETNSIIDLLLNNIEYKNIHVLLKKYKIKLSPYKFGFYKEIDINDELLQETLYQFLKIIVIFSNILFLKIYQMENIQQY